MTLAVVPVAPLERGKLRLSTIFSREERKMLMKAMLTDVLLALEEAKSVEETLVVTSDEEILKLARRLGVSSLKEGRPEELNSAVREATNWALKSGFEGMLVIHADLPLVKPHLIDNVTSVEEPCVVLCPSRDGGTNMLFRSPPGVIDPLFGPLSFARHLENARRVGVEARVFDSFFASLDVDTPSDLYPILIYGFGTHTYGCVKSLSSRLMSDKERLRRALAGNDYHGYAST